MQHPKKNSIQSKVFQSISEVNKCDWETILNRSNIFLSIPYLDSLEKTITEVPFYYILFYKNDNVVGLAYIQHIQPEMVKNQTKKEAHFLSGDTLKELLITSLNLDFLVCGNVFATGQNGFVHSPFINRREFLKALNNTIQKIFSDEQCLQKAFIILFKESFEKENLPFGKEYKTFEIDAPMVLDLLPAWLSVEDYLDAMKTKFRTKIKGILKKSEALQIIDMDEERIESHLSSIGQLYAAVIEKADFKMTQMTGNTFLKLKTVFQEKVFFRGYFWEQKMIGFSFAFFYENVLDAQFVGIDYAYNKDYALYQRMIFDFIEQGIKLKAKEVRLGRTAEEIKSAFGAQPIQATLHAKHTQLLMNKFLQSVLKNISPSPKRLNYPFKELSVKQ